MVEQTVAPGVEDEVVAALAEARHPGWDSLLSAQRAYLDDFWDGADIELDGDTELQQAVRFALFHVLQAAARAEGRAIPAKGLTGPGYDGHTFWDAERYILPVLTYSAPSAVGTHCGGARRPRPRADAPRSGSPGPSSRGAPSVGMSAPVTGPRAPRRSTSAGDRRRGRALPGCNR